MARRILATVAVAVLLTTAGCGAAFGGDPQTRTPFDVDPTPTPTGTPTEPPTETVTATAPTASPTPTPAAPPELARALSAQERRLGLLDSFTLSYDVATEVNGTAVTFRNTTARINVSEAEGAVRTRYQRPRRSNTSEYGVYRDNGVLVSRRVGADGSVRYRTPRPSSTPASDATAFFAEFADRMSGVEFERNGSATFEGRVMPRYTASGTDAAPTTRNLTNYRATLLVDDDGLLRRVEIVITDRNDEGERLVERTTLAVNAVDETTVDAPDWVDEARARTGNATTTSG